ncbi:MAG: phosphomannomutase/phosphoglucomutase [Thermomonas sp.]|uniref:phosphomannomutase/phosphoglucomutase n=1 Tax=Thermomonas sp. TaxID=1971895 RepID=UPI001D296633|nr:phosphomannomutase/phosphoglucomutase [Thermomonas sp.]MBZ0087766.1 phosphomannomutase/phosphoglucomutase [Thermomonas sp.]
MAVFGLGGKGEKGEHAGSEKPKLEFDPLQAARALPWLVALLGALALWCLIAGGLRLRDDSRLNSLESARDDAALAIRRKLDEQRRKLDARLASAEFKTALTAGGPQAATALRKGWPEVMRAEVWPADLDASYAGLPRSGFGPLAAAEAALSSGKTSVRVVQAGTARRLALAAPVQAAGVRVAYAEIPLDALSNIIETTKLPGGVYIALRQGGQSVIEGGDTALSNSAEALSVKIPDSDLRLVAATPDETRVPFGLGALAGVVLGLVLAGIAAVLWLVLRPRLLAMGGQAEVEAGPTLAELQPAKPAEERTLHERVKEEPKPVKEKVPVVIDHRIFRAYDIRGVIGHSLDAGVAELIGQAVGSSMAEQGLDTIVVGRDGRLSGPDLVQGLIAGLRKAGRNVIDIGMVPTPVVYFGTFHLRTGCGVAVTGSHNPPDYNGFKIVVGGETLSGPAIKDLHARIAEDRLLEAEAQGTLDERDIGQDYVQRISGDVQIGQRLKVVVDAGNGVAGEIGPQVLAAVGADVTPLFCDIDGEFPNHHPDPSEPRNLEALIQMVQKLDADIGIAFDGDGDRLGVVTKAGNIIYPDRLLMLFAADVLERNPGAVIVYDVKCTSRLSTQILRHGGSPMMWKTGHSLIKAKMRETDAALAGEMSGHFFFAERWFGFDDGIYAAARLLEILDGQGQPAEDVFAALPDGVSTPEIKVELPGETDPHEFVDRLRLSATFEGGRLTSLDGVRVDWPDGWGLVRASNTTPVLVMRFDADNNDALARIQRLFSANMLALEPNLQLPFC